MEDAKLLNSWIIDKEYEPERYWFEKTPLLVPNKRVSIPTFCGNCFSRISDSGGTFTFSCTSCMGGENRGYELHKLSEILKINWIDTIVFAAQAIDELFRDSQSVEIMYGILRKH